MKKYCALTILLLIHLAALAQNNMLQKVIAVDFKNITMYEALMQIEAKAGFYFSYDNQFIKNQKRLSFAVSGKPVKEVLDMILDNEYQYIVNNNKIVIRKKDTEYITIQGRFFDHTDQQPLAYVTVYDPEWQRGATSGEDGSFSVRLPLKNQVRLVASRVSYYDTALIIDAKNNQPLHIGLSPRIATEQTVIIRPVERHWLARSLIGTRQKVSTLNLKDYFYQRKFQIGVWPGIGTKSALKGQQENRFSFNVLGGYAAQVDAFELGGLFNVVQKHARSLQIGGLANIVGGTMNGVQIGGLYNYTGDTVKGVQIGGLVNVSKGPVSGLQIGGIYNKTPHFKGLQIAGLVNNTAQLDKAMQLSGLVNRASSFKRGFQLTGLVNGAKQINGAQVSGLLNVAKQINGFQLGVFNMADTLNGISIGPFNYSRNGKHSLSFSMNENGQLNLAYKSGSYKLYNIVQLGWIDSARKGDYYILGYGLGKEWALKQKIRIAAELINLNYISGHAPDMDYSTVLLQPLIIYQPFKKLQVFAGPRLQYQLPVYRHGQDHYKRLRQNMIPLTQSEKDGLYLGFTAGINIF